MAKACYTDYETGKWTAKKKFDFSSTSVESLNQTAKLQQKNHTTFYPNFTHKGVYLLLILYSFSIQLHLVFYNIKYANFDAAADKPDGLTVIAVFLEVNIPF